MAREKELFRDNLQRLDERFPECEILTVAQVKEYTGYTDFRTLKKYYGVEKRGISKVKFASALS